VTRTADLRRIIYKQIEDRCQGNVERWGDERHLTELLWHAVLAEEAGEVAMAAHDVLPNGELRKELIDVSAVAVAMIEAIDDLRMESLDYSPGHPLKIVRDLGVMYGHVARAILERKAAGVIRREISECIAVMSSILRDTYDLGLEPRDFEGEDDQESVLAAERGKHESFSFIAAAAPDDTYTGILEDRIVPLRDVLDPPLKALPIHQVPSPEGLPEDDHEWIRQPSPVDGLTAIYLCPHCMSALAVADPEVLKGFIIPMESAYYRGSGSEEPWTTVCPPCSPERRGAEVGPLIHEIVIREASRGTVPAQLVDGLHAPCCRVPPVVNLATMAETTVVFTSKGARYRVAGLHWRCVCGESWFTGAWLDPIRAGLMPEGVIVTTV
jgi:hypothetical protein